MDSSGEREKASPPWEPGTRLVVGTSLILLLVIGLWLLRELIPPLIISSLFAYILHPAVSALTRKLKVSRTLAVVIVYIILVVIVLVSTTGLGLAASERVVQLGSYLRDLSVELPKQIMSLAEQTFQLGPWQIDLTRTNLEPFLSEVATALRPILSQTGSLIASIARATASAVTLVFLVMILGYYMLVDFGRFDDAFLRWVPAAYRSDFRIMFVETSELWSSFLRGQGILALVIGMGVWIILSILGVQFSLVLGLIAGLMEFVPMFGPLIAAIVAVLVAVFQESNWLGFSPLGYGALILVIFLIIQQIENNILVPRIIGKSLKMHPLAVLISILAGGLLAGVLGLILAAPTVATMRLWAGYAYRKTVGLEAWPDLPSFDEVVQPRRPSGFRTFVSGLRAKLQPKEHETNERSGDEPEHR
ncbi:MAG: AI-2E family transporter [Anaerolineales bacterium]|nr:AI-2E family transporter [Anaerolineales bacterium]